MGTSSSVDVTHQVFRNRFYPIPFLTPLYVTFFFSPPLFLGIVSGTVFLRVVFSPDSFFLSVERNVFRTDFPWS